MPTPLPIACSLTATEADARSREWRALAAGALLEKSHIEGGVRLRFASSERVEAALRDLVDAERECCPFLTLALKHSDGAIELDVSGPAEAAPIIEAFASA